MVASIHKDKEARVATRLFDQWLPTVAILMSLPSTSCQDIFAMSPTLRSKFYKYKVVCLPPY